VTFPAATAFAGTELEALNRLLLECGLMMVGTTTLDPASDASMALAVLRSVYRQEAHRGWYCFNKRDGIKLTPNVNGEIIPQGLILRAEVSPRAAAANCSLPQVTVTAPVGGVQKLMRLPERTTNFSDIAEIEVDLIYGLGFEDAPEAFINWVIAKAAQKFGPTVQHAVDPTALQDAHRNLLQAEADCEPQYNAFSDDPYVAMTWAR
jgi:hypothetical protein